MAFGAPLGVCGTSIRPWVLLITLLPIDVLLVLRESSDSGSWLKGGHWSSSWIGRVRGDPWTEELLVRVVPGDMVGDPWWELEATDDALMAEAGTRKGFLIVKGLRIV
jgi:hypothetical protein